MYNAKDGRYAELVAIALAGTTETEKMLSCAKQNVINKGRCKVTDV